MKRLNTVKSKPAVTANKGQQISGLLQQGLAHHRKGQLGDAQTLYDKILRLQPKHFDALQLSATIAAQTKHHELAIQLFAQALALKPDSADAYSNRGIALRELKRFDDALADYDRAIAIRPDYAEAFYNRGIALKELKRMDDALASFDRAIAIKPDYAEAHYNRGLTLQEIKRLDDALVSYDRVIAIRPDDAEAHWNKALILLLGADFKRGWQWHEWRWKRGGRGLTPRPFKQPLWLGTTDISNKVILLHAEQGLGDTIQFCRYAKLVQARGARVLLEVPKALMGLLETLEGVDALLEQGKPLPAFDYHCPLLSLPLAFKTELDTIPSSLSYLSAASNKREEWTARLGDKHKPRIGLVWSGSTGHKNDHNRSLTLSELLPSLPDGFEYVSLQKEVRATDKEVLAASGIKHYGEQLNDFTDTAALCERMDVVISVDTSVAHLAGAIGKPTWILLPYVPDWRWLLDREDSPWYPTVTLYRQEKMDDWTSVLEKINTQLTRLQST